MCVYTYIYIYTRIPRLHLYIKTWRQVPFQRRNHDPRSQTKLKADLLFLLWKLQGGPERPEPQRIIQGIHPTNWSKRDHYILGTSGNPWFLFTMLLPVLLWTTCIEVPCHIGLSACLKIGCPFNLLSTYIYKYTYVYIYIHMYSMYVCMYVYIYICITWSGNSIYSNWLFTSPGTIRELWTAPSSPPEIIFVEV